MTKQAGFGLALTQPGYTDTALFDNQTNVYNLEQLLRIPSDIPECIMLHDCITLSVQAKFPL